MTQHVLPWSLSLYMCGYDLPLYMRGPVHEMKHSFGLFTAKMDSASPKVFALEKENDEEDFLLTVYAC